MTLKNKCILFTNTFLIMVLLGCTPKNHVSGSKLDGAIEAIQNNNISQTSELIHLVGEPEIKSRISVLPALLEKKSIRHDLIERLMKEIYDLYTNTTSKTEINSIDNWRDSNEFNNIDIWIYNFSHPSEIVIGGIIEKRTGHYLTWYFLIENNNVFTGGITQVNQKSK